MIKRGLKSDIISYRSFLLGCATDVTDGVKNAQMMSYVLGDAMKQEVL
jgi:hypothetical protein